MKNKCYQKHKEKNAKEEALETYQNLSEEEKIKSHKKAWKRYQNFTEEEKGRRVSVFRNVTKTL